MKRLALLSVIGLALVACLGSDFSDSVNGTWQMTSGVVDGEDIPALDDHPITISFEDDWVTGTAACNGYSGTYQLSSSGISFDGLAMTEMACFPEHVMRAESMYAEAITRVDTVTLDNGLILSGEGVELIFETLEPAPDADLTNTVWVLEGVIQNGAVATPALDTRASLEFFTDGSMLGDTGCRPFAGRYTVSEAEVILTEMTADGQQCEPELSEQDSHFLAVLGDRFTFRIEGDRLSLSGWDGNIGLAFISGT
jgi:heat shock protein HslJ